MAQIETRGTLSGHLGGVKAARRMALGMAVMLTFAGCGGGTTLQPVAGPGVPPSVQDLGSLRVSVTAGAWQFRPRSLTEHVLPFLVAIRNLGPQPVPISRGDFLLLDDANRQYLSLAPTEALALVGSSSSGVAVAPSIGVGGSTGGGGTIFGGGLGISLGGYGGVDARDVIPRALPEGPVQPGAEVQGFLYFPYPAAAYQSLRFVVAPSALPGQPRADFLFRKVP